ncbi:serine protease [Paenibacillus polymyxa]|uniref:PDZ domain-containing protein n=1 Tax=Paenibacillus TaxID=44249 RepID=UPI00042EB68E|nr:MULTISPECIES: PDZ domain-containing protein [Paenibacillus]AHM68200.1 trypsin-like serine protease [Paenibacillus polymyxa SQR-21]KAF6656807.1 PDZ domain-containing protein [Paenibacillus sp. EKM301P]RPD96933.1 PDZ domain-containing protein [Paenibacillus polymyxa]UBS86828.1 PDZ domain-containing protein [Paenibacillus polymyxa]WHX35404.1 PDZ domain-containing protein [Paenibacillus polymyxa]
MDLEWALQWGWSVLNACLYLLLQPFYYISILIVALGYRRQMLLERKLFHTRMHSWAAETWRVVWSGLLAGMALSALGMFVSVHLNPTSIVCLWVATLLLMLVRVRYLCLAYSVGLLGVVQFFLNIASGWQPGGVLGTSVVAIRGLDIPALLVLVAVLHVAEALLVRWQGGKAATPLFVEGKRGRLVGGYRMEDLWPIPLLLLVPAQGGFMLPWTPLFGGDAGTGYMLAALPVLMGFSSVTLGQLPRQKAVLTSNRLLLYSVALLLLSLLAAWWGPLILLAALFSFLAHEALIWYGNIEESRLSPMFVHPEQGLRVLAVLPDSPATAMGILPGEAIYRVNGMVVNSRAELHQALRINSAFCKLEVRNLQGESKFVQRGMYDGDHHQLGVVLAPDADAGWAVSIQPASIYRIVAMHIGARRRKAGQASKAEGTHLDTMDQ